MYETLEHWKQYKQEKALQAKIAEELKLKQAIKEANDGVNDLSEYELIIK